MKNKKTEKNKYEKNHKYVARMMCFIALFCVSFALLQFLLASDKNSYTRVMEHEMYNAEKNIDVLFVGSSHTYRQYIPSIIDEYLGSYSFNAGSSAQNLDGGLALIKEADKNNDINTVFVELCPTGKGEVYSERTSFTETYIIGDYMHFGINKILFLLRAVPRNHYVNAFFPLLRNKQNYSDAEFVRNAIQLKTDKQYQNYSHPGIRWKDEEWYEDRGYVANRIAVENENWSSAEKKEPISKELFSEDERETLDEIVKYCKSNNMRLVFLATPLTDFLLTQHGNYDDGREQIQEFADNNGVEFYDFNLCRPEYFTCKSEKFKDPSHMNCYGAEEYSKLIGRFFSGGIPEEDLFYSSYKDKLADMNNKVFGLIYNIRTNENDKIIHLEPITSNNFTVYASVKKQSEGEQEEIIYEKQKLKDIHIDINDTGCITVVLFGDSPDGEITNIIKINY